MLTGLAGGGAVLLAGCPGSDGGVPLFTPSDEQMAELGLQSWQQIRQQVPLSDDRSLQQRVDRVGAEVVQAVGGSPADWEFAVFASDQANAFALPGGKVGIFEGMFRYIENDAQLATIIGHEIGHVVEEHSAERMSRALATRFGLQAAEVLLSTGGVSYSAEIAAVLGLGAQYGIQLPFSREQEREADRLGLTYMARAGYDPRASVDFWQNFAGAPGEAPPQFLSTHPSAGDRIDRLQAEMPGALEIYRRQVG